MVAQPFLPASKPVYAPQRNQSYMASPMPSGQPLGASFYPVVDSFQKDSQSKGQFPATLQTRPVSPYSAAPRLIDLVHINDYHEAFSVLPQIVEAMKRLTLTGEQQGQTVLRLDTGDNNIAKEPEDWALNVKLLNAMHLDAATFGNHEFDLGVPQLSQSVQRTNFPILASNLSVPESSSMMQASLGGHWMANCAILPRDGQTFGLIGVTTPKLKTYLHADTELDGVDTLPFEVTANVVQAMVHQLEQRGVKNIILLSHMGYELDKDLIDPKKGNVHGVDVIVGGHSHTELSGVKPGTNLFADSSGQPVYIVQTGKNGHHIGLTQVYFDNEGHVHPVNSQLLDPMQFKADAASLAAVFERFGPDRRICQLSHPYNNSFIGEREDPMANLLSDFVKQTSNADMAFTRSPCLRDDAKDLLTHQHIREMLPFQNPLVVVELTGKELMQTLNEAATALRDGQSHPGLLHPSSNMHIQLNKATGQTEQVLLQNKQTGQWEALDLKRTYQVAMDDYPLGSAEFPEIKGKSPVMTLPFSMQEALEQAIGWRVSQSPAVANPLMSLPTLNLYPDGRLQIVGQTPVASDMTATHEHPHKHLA